MNRPFDTKCAQLDDLLGVGRSFDMVSRELYVGGCRAKMWVVNGYAKDLLLERTMEKLQAIGTLDGIRDVDELLRRYHPDYREDGFTVLQAGPSRGTRVPKELGNLLQANSRLLGVSLEGREPDYQADVLIIGAGGAGCAAALEAEQAGARVLIATKLRMGDANTMMAEGGIQAADKENDSPVRHYLDAFGGGHFAARPELRQYGVLLAQGVGQLCMLFWNLGVLVFRQKKRLSPEKAEKGAEDFIQPL